MKFFWILILGFVYVGTGCRSAQPVSSTQQNTVVEKDSTNNKTVEKNDSIYSEVDKPVNIPAGKVDIGFTKKQFDSLLAILSAMQSLPTETKTIYKIDPTSHLKLKIFMDSLGNVHFQCMQDAQTYWQKFVHERVEKEKLQSQLDIANTKIKSRDTELVEARKSWWDRVKDGFDHWLIKFLILLIIVGVIIAVFDYGFAYVKQLKWLSVIFNFLKSIFKPK